MVSDDEDEENIPKSRHTSRDPVPLFKPVFRDGNLRTTTTREENVHDLVSPGTQLPTQPPSNVILTDIEEENLSSASPQAELLWCHYRLGNYSFARLRILAALGVLPSNILQVKPPKCAGGLYGAMTKHLWRTKSANNRGSIR